MIYEVQSVRRIPALVAMRQKAMPNGDNLTLIADVPVNRHEAWKIMETWLQINQPDLELHRVGSTTPSRDAGEDFLWYGMVK